MAAFTPDLLALVRREGRQEILEIAVARIAPVKLAGGAQQMAFRFEQVRVLGREKQPVQGGCLVFPHEFQGAVDELFFYRRGFSASNTQQPRSRDGSERYAGNQFGIVTQAGLLIGVSPSPVKPIFP